MELLKKFKNSEKVLLISLVILPFMKGLFFREVFIPAFIFFLILFIYLILNSDFIYYDKKLVFLFILQIIISIGSAVYGINKDEAIYGILIMLLPVIIYFLFINLRSHHEDTAFLILFFLLFSSSIISIINFIMEQRFNSTNQLIRFVWVIPYANTLAVYLFAGSLAGLYLLTKKLDINIKIPVSLGICLNISAMVFTYSRTMLILAAFFYLGYLIINRDNKIRLDFLFIFIISNICVILYSILKWNFFLPIFIMGLIGLYIYFKVNDRIFNGLINLLNLARGNKKFLIAFAVAFLLLIASAAVAGAIIFKTTDVYDRVKTIGSGDQSLMERFAYYRDSISIIKDYPVFGVGAGGWSSILYKYQTANYFPEYVHSSIFQTALNYGLAGLIIFLLQIILLIGYFIKAVKNKKNKDNLQIYCLFMINAAILLHSLIDLDFEFQIINIIFWINIALLSQYSVNTLDKAEIKFVTRIINVCILSLLIFGCSSIFISNAYYLIGSSGMDKGDYKAAVKAYSGALAFNPLSSEAYYGKGYSLGEIFLDNSDDSFLKDSIANIKKAVNYNRYNPEYIDREAFMYYLSQNYDESSEIYERLVSMQPLKLKNYENYSLNLLYKAKALYNLGKVSEADNEFNKIKKIPDMINTVKQRLSPNALKLKHKPELTLSSNLSYNIIEACYYLKDYENARYYSKLAQKDNSYIPKIKELINMFEKNK